HDPRGRGPVPDRAVRRRWRPPGRAGPRVWHYDGPQAPLRLVRRGPRAPDLRHLGRLRDRVDEARRSRRLRRTEDLRGLRPGWPTARLPADRDGPAGARRAGLRDAEGMVGID